MASKGGKVGTGGGVDGGYVGEAQGHILNGRLGGRAHSNSDVAGAALYAKASLLAEVVVVFSMSS